MKDLEEDLYDGQVLQKLFGKTKEIILSDSCVYLLFWPFDVAFSV